MDFVSVEEAKQRSGVRLVAPKAWATWAECAKGVLHVKNIPYVAVEQVTFGENTELVAWTGVRNQPQVIFDDEPVRTHWLDILNLAERLAPEPALLPADPEDRIQVIGLANELCGQDGLIWTRRLELAATNPPSGLAGAIMRGQYGVKDGGGEDAERRSAEIVALFGGRLRAAQRRGSRYLVGDKLSVADIYWACVSNMLGFLPQDLCPVPPALREKLGALGPVLAAAVDPIVFEHRDYIYRTYLELPVEFG